MNKEKIREKYPNIKSEEEFEKIRTMLIYKNNKIITILCALALSVLGALLYRINFIITVICIVAAIAIWWIGESRWGQNIDEFFLAKASRKKVENRVVLSRESLQQTLKKYTVKELGSDFFASELVGLFCLIVWGFWLMFSDADLDTEIPVFIFFCIIPLIAFGIFRIGAILKRVKTKHNPYIILQAKIKNRKSISSSDPESNTESYYFVFNCAKYGEIDYEVSHNRYHAAFVGVDEYYLIIVKRRFSKKYKIVEIFATEEYALDSNLEMMLK